jgi:3-oxoacyl-[acyl-carrier protein] reductase
MMRLSDRVALITGAGGSIGTATAFKLSSEGAAVVINDVFIEGPQETVDEIVRVGGRAIAIKADVTAKVQVESMIQQAMAAFGHIDILINNAGVSPKHSLLEISEQDWERVIDIHMKGSFLCCQAVVPQMMKNRFGKIVNLSSGAAYGSIYSKSHYSAAKAGLMGLTRSLAVELGPHNINVNAVAPGFVESEMTRTSAKLLGIDFEEFKRTVAERNPLRRVGQPQDIANVICFLVSEEASYIHGEIIHVSGGPSRGF